MDTEIENLTLTQANKLLPIDPRIERPHEDDCECYDCSPVDEDDDYVEDYYEDDDHSSNEEWMDE